MSRSKWRVIWAPPSALTTSVTLRNQDAPPKSPYVRAVKSVNRAPQARPVRISMQLRALGRFIEPHVHGIEGVVDGPGFLEAEHDCVASLGQAAASCPLEL